MKRSTSTTKGCTSRQNGIARRTKNMNAATGNQIHQPRRHADLRLPDAMIREEFLDRQMAAQQYDLHRLPEDAGDTVRIIHVGDYDACPCSGPHVHSTREIGVFRIVSTTHENGVLRIRFKLDL